eukprot:g55965.t1
MVTSPRRVLLCEDVLVEHTQAIKLQRLRKEYKQIGPQSNCRPVRRAVDCAAGVILLRLDSRLLRAGRRKFLCALACAAGARLAPRTGSHCAGAPRTVVCLRCVPVALAAEADSAARKKNAELQQSLLVVVDGCSRQAHEGQRKELLKVLRSDCKVSGNEGCGRTRPINIRTWRQVLVLPEANGESVWTSDQLRQKGLTVTLALLAAPASSESLTYVPSSEELAQYLHACMLEDVALGGPPARQASADGYEQWLSAFSRDVATQEKLPGLDKPVETALPHVFRVKQGKNKGRFAIRPGDLVASFERFLDLCQGKLSERAEERFWARLQESFPQLDLTKKLAHNIYASSGKERDNASEKPGARPARAAQLVFPNPNIQTDSRFTTYGGADKTGSESAHRLQPPSLENKNSKLSNLDISLNNIGPQGAKHIAEAIQENKTVIELRMEVNKIGPAGAEAIANMLKVNLTLTALDFGRNGTGPQGAQSIADAIKVNSSLKILQLSWNGIGDEGVKHFAAALKTCCCSTLPLAATAASPAFKHFFSGCYSCEPCFKILFWVYAKTGRISSPRDLHPSLSGIWDGKNCRQDRQIFFQQKLQEICQEFAANGRYGDCRHHRKKEKKFAALGSLFFLTFGLS